MKQDKAVKEYEVPLEMHKEFLSGFVNGTQNYNLVHEYAEKIANSKL